jgi:hypothetical protein
MSIRQKIKQKIKKITLDKYKKSIVIDEFKIKYIIQHINNYNQINEIKYTLQIVDKNKNKVN